MIRLDENRSRTGAEHTVAPLLAQKLIERFHSLDFTVTWSRSVSGATIVGKLDWEQNFDSFDKAKKIAFFWGGFWSGSETIAYTHTRSSHFAKESVSFASGRLCARQMHLPKVQVHYSTIQINTNNELVERGRYSPQYKGVSSGGLWACQKYPAHILTVLHERVNNPSAS